VSKRLLVRSTPHWSCQFLVLERFPRGKRDPVSSMGCQHNREEAKAGISGRVLRLLHLESRCKHLKYLLSPVSTVLSFRPLSSPSCSVVRRCLQLVRHRRFLIARGIDWCGTPMQKLPRTVAVDFATLHAVLLGHAWVYGSRCMQNQPLTLLQAIMGRRRSVPQPCLCFV